METVFKYKDAINSETSIQKNAKSEAFLEQ